MVYQYSNNITVNGLVILPSLSKSGLAIYRACDNTERRRLLRMRSSYTSMWPKRLRWLKLKVLTSLERSTPKVWFGTILAFMLGKMACLYMGKSRSLFAGPVEKWFWPKKATQRTYTSERPPPSATCGGNVSTFQESCSSGSQ